MIGLVDYGAGNLRSVEFALEALDVPSRRVGEPDALDGVDRLILPGVGAAASAMEELRARELVGALREWEGPLLGICLGMQLLVESSEEGGGAVACLGLLPGRVRRIRTDGPLPHMGWNALDMGRTAPERSGGPLLAGLRGGTHVYFLHSLRVETDEAAVAARTEYGEEFPAALERGRLSGVQFHPEKSGGAGLRILANFAGLDRPGDRVRSALAERESTRRESTRRESTS